jgi:hypothetical protein
MTTKRQYVLTNAPQGVLKIKDLPAEYARTVDGMCRVGMLRRVSRGCYERVEPPERVTLKKLILENLPTGVFSVKELAARMPSNPYARNTLNVEVRNLVTARQLFRVGPRAYSTTPNPTYAPVAPLREAVLNLVPDVEYVSLREITIHFPKHLHSSVRATLRSLMDYGSIHKVDQRYSQGSCPKVSAAANQFLYGGLK